MIGILQGIGPFPGMEEAEEEEQNLVPGDFALLHERFTNRKIRNASLQPGDFVQLKMPKTHGMRHTGPFIVVEVLDTPVRISDTNVDIMGSTFSQAEADIILGMMFPRGDARTYRESYEWSGNLELYTLTELERAAIDSVKVPADTSANTAEPPALSPETAKRASAKQSGWSGFPE